MTDVGGQRTEWSLVPASFEEGILCLSRTDERLFPIRPPFSVVRFPCLAGLAATYSPMS